MVHQKCVFLFQTFEDVKCRNFAARSHGKVRETLFPFLAQRCSVRRMTATTLVVEDDRLIRDLVCNPLHRDGHQVLEACDGAIPLEIVSNATMDLVITDFVMPKLDGIKFIEQVHSFQPRIPIILITGCPTPLSSTIKLDAMAEVLAKPFEFDALRSTVRRLLNSTSHTTTS
jgi:DNA-binding NtrC family response regulator